jgi:hypothetical protein
MELFYKYVCDYVLENITMSRLINAAIECTSEIINSENLYILAGLSEKFDRDKILLYYELTLEELKIKEPNKKEAGEYLLLYYCDELIKGNINPDNFLQKVKHEIFDKNIGKERRIVGDYLGIEKIIGIYYEISDLKETIGYEEKINIKNEIHELYKECYKEAEKYLNNNSIK